MGRFPFLLLQIFGIFPFKITNQNKTLYSKFLHIWSVFFNTSVIFASLMRTFLIVDESFYTGSVYSFLFKYESHFVLIGITMESSPTFLRNLLNLLKIYVQTIVKGTSSETNFEANKAAIVILIYICIHVICVQTFLSPLKSDWASFLNLWISVAQSIYNLMHFLHFYIVLYIINYNLKEIEKKIKILGIRPDRYRILVKERILKSLDQNLKIYKYFSKIFYLFVEMIICQVFYDTVVALKFIEDIMCSKIFTIGPEIVMTIWHLYGTPLLFIVIHQGHIFQERVNDVFVLLKKNLIIIESLFSYRKFRKL